MKIFLTVFSFLVSTYALAQSPVKLSLVDGKYVQQTGPVNMKITNDLATGNLTIENTTKIAPGYGDKVTYKRETSNQFANESQHVFTKTDIAECAPNKDNPFPCAPPEYDVYNVYDSDTGVFLLQAGDVVLDKDPVVILNSTSFKYERSQYQLIRGTVIVKQWLSGTDSDDANSIVYTLKK